MNDLDKICEEAERRLPLGHTAADILERQRVIKSAIEKAVEESWRTASTEYRVGLIKDKPAHANEHGGLRMIHRNGDLRWELDGKEGDFIASVEPENASKICKAFYEKFYSRAAHRVEKDAAGASDDNCRKCGRPLGWFEPGLCDDCRKARAGKPKPLERCSSNPHYEAHFGDEPATTAHASDGGICPECGTEWTKHGTFCGKPAHSTEK